MTRKPLISFVAIGLSCLTLAGCVSEGEPYRSRPPVYRERIVEDRNYYRTNDYRPRRPVNPDRYDANRDDRHRPRGDDRPICNERGCIDPNDPRFRG